MKNYLKPLFLERIRRVSVNKIEQYNKDVIASLTGKRKAISRPARSVKYKAMCKLPCSKCEMYFMNSSQLRIHKKNVHTANISASSFTNIPMLDNISLLDLTVNEETEQIENTLGESCDNQIKAIAMEKTKFASISVIFVTLKQMLLQNCLSTSL